MKAMGLIFALAIAALAAWSLRSQDLQASAPLISATSTPPGPVVTAADLAPLAAGIRSLKLVTVELSLEVESEATDASLLGTVSATLTAPAILRFGCDLSGLSSSSITISPIHKLYIITVPPPTRLSTEAMGQFAKANVTTTGLRSRSSDGERLLGELRRDLQLRASQASPTPGQLESIRNDTRSQIEALVAKLVGSGHGVRVRFTDEARDQAQATQKQGTPP